MNIRNQFPCFTSARFLKKDDQRYIFGYSIFSAIFSISPYFATKFHEATARYKIYYNDSIYKKTDAASRFFLINRKLTKNYISKNKIFPEAERVKWGKKLEGYFYMIK